MTRAVGALLTKEEKAAECGPPTLVMVCSLLSWLRMLILLPACSAECRNGGRIFLSRNKRHREIQMGNIFV